MNKKLQNNKQVIESSIETQIATKPRTSTNLFDIDQSTPVITTPNPPILSSGGVANVQHGEYDVFAAQ